MVNLRSQAAKTRYHQQLVRQMIILERIFAKHISPIIKKQFRSAAHEIRNGNMHINSAVEKHKWDMLKAFKKAYRQIAVTFAKYSDNKLKSLFDSNYEMKADPDMPEFTGTEDERFYQAMQFWVNIYSARKVKTIDENTIKKIKEIIARQMSKDRTNAEIADEIEAIEEIASKSRAMTIARTETHSVAVMAVDTAIRTSVIGSSLEKKEWNTFEDEATREEHIQANGEVVGIDEPFVETGEEMQFPGDPNGEAWNVVNCRCVVSYYTAEVDTQSVPPGEVIEEEAA